ncbi:MAG: septation protein A [Alphaproteobacteria bacterium]|nr:septation protein A [Alphaproteobacteria bacterium]
MSRPSGALLRLALEIGPLLVFFLVNARADIFWATAVFMILAPAAVLASRHFERRWPVLPLVTAIFVLLFGALTLVLQDELFIKLKPTLVNGLFALILFGGLAFGHSLLKLLLADMLPLTDFGWRLLTYRWAWFFVLLAVLNEYVWRNFTTDQWVSFKVFGIFPLTLAFSLLQLPILQRHRLPDAATASPPERD